jgi:hypothetical protein
VHPVGDDVAELERLQRAVVGDDRVPAADRQPRRADLLIAGWRILAQAVQAAPNALEPPLPSVMGQ